MKMIEIVKITLQDHIWIDMAHPYSNQLELSQTILSLGLIFLYMKIKFRVTENDSHNEIKFQKKEEN